MTQNTLLTCFLAFSVLFSIGRKRSENPALYFKDLRKELKSVALKEDRLFKTNLLPNNWNALNIAHKDVIEELDKAVDQLNKTNAFKGDDHIKVQYLVGFKGLKELYEVDYTQIIQFRRYISRSDSDAVKYYTFLNNYTKRTLELHQSISKAEKKFVRRHRLKGIDQEVFIKQHKQYVKLSDQLKHNTVFFKRIDVKILAVFNTIKVFEKQKVKAEVIDIKTKELQLAFEQSKEEIAAPQSTKFLSEYYESSLMHFQERLMPLIEIMQSQERSTAAWKNASEDADYVRLDYNDIRDDFIENQEDWLADWQKKLGKI